MEHPECADGALEVGLVSRRQGMQTLWGLQLSCQARLLKHFDKAET